ncbi:MAG: DMT family transporter [Alphaproteobacteria bacterium]
MTPPAAKPTISPNLAGTRLVLAFGLLLAIGATWGSTYVLAKIVAESGGTPAGMALLQAVGGGLVLVALGLARGRLPRLGWRHGGFCAVTGLLGTALPSSVWFWVAPNLPSGVVAIEAALVPMVTLGITLALRVEGFEARRVAGIAFGLVAVGLLTLPETSMPDPAMVPWVLIGLAVPVSYATENMVLALRRPADLDALTLLTGMMVMASLMLLPLAWLTDGWWLPWPWTEESWLFVVFVAINVLSYLGFIELIRLAGPVFAAQEGYIITITGVLWGVALLDERHSGWIWAAVAVMMAGLALVNPRATRRPAPGR